MYANLSNIDDPTTAMIRPSNILACTALVICATSCSGAPEPSRPIIHDMDPPDPPDTSHEDMGRAVMDMTGPDQTPAPSRALVRAIVGDPADAGVEPLGPGLILMGGGPDVDEAFEWWRARVNGGDVVVLRASGSDGYNDYLFSDIGGAHSVETLLVTTRTLAEDPYVAATVGAAEGIFIAGGDQSVYLESWRDTALSRALRKAWSRGAVIGGTSAGCAILGEHVFAASRGTMTSEQALGDPYHERATLEGAFLPTDVNRSMLTDTHFYERDRLGRLVALLARLVRDGVDDTPFGLGIDEGTAVVIDARGLATVLGDDYVYVMDGSTTAERCVPGEPLQIDGVRYVRLESGDTFSVVDRSGLTFDRTLDARDGTIIGDDLY